MLSKDGLLANSTVNVLRRENHFPYPVTYIAVIFLDLAYQCGHIYPTTNCSRNHLVVVNYGTMATCNKRETLEQITIIIIIFQATSSMYLPLNVFHGHSSGCSH
jgi:hypothetical protein